MKKSWLLCLVYIVYYVKVSNCGENTNNTSLEGDAVEVKQAVCECKDSITDTLVQGDDAGEGQIERGKKAKKKTLQPQTEKDLTGLPSGGILFPRASESRDVRSLDGVWSFKTDLKEMKGITEKWYEKDIKMMPNAILMPVPSSYNDITISASIRDHLGLVWYQRTFFVPSAWKLRGQRVWLRFASVQYIAQVWMNGKKVMTHEIGHLPFQGEVTSFVNFGFENTVTVSVDNRLGPETIPQGTWEEIETNTGPKKVQKFTFGFYNYAGIDGPVYLYTTPKVYLDDVLLTSVFERNTVLLRYKLSYKGSPIKENIDVSVNIIDKYGASAGFQRIPKHDSLGYVMGEFEVQEPKLWWPYLMSSDPGYLYTIEIKVTSLNTSITDVYRQPFGLRDIKWSNTSISINNMPIYIRGFSRHTDSDIRGKGQDLPTSVKDHNLLKWVGANTYRTSNYPLTEEEMDLAEQMGFMIIDEVSSVNTEAFTQVLLVKHKIALAELINRDKNRACVIMWSVANEPETEVMESGPYFGSVVSFTRSRDKTRPITAVLNRWNTVDQAGQWMDVICFNRFNGYFKEPGRWEIIQLAVENEARYWYNKYNKPVMMAEYGVETYEGLHSLPEYMWTEEYQIRVFSEHFKAFDNLRRKGWFIGEMVFSFTDFKTDQSITRVGTEQKKGIFTRRRHPKSSAFFIRKRNFKLATILDGAPLPSDLDLYSAPTEEVNN